MNYLSELSKIVEKNRSYRRFFESERISTELLKSWVNLARLSPSARNMQSLKYILVNNEEQNNKISPLLSWAGYLKDWNGPTKGERPSAYIVILNDEKLSDNYYCDDGIVSQSILLGATASGYGGCIIAAIRRPDLRGILHISKQYKIIHIIALGKPKEEIQIETLKNNEIKYWRDEKGVHHVPKRELDELIIQQK